MVPWVMGTPPKQSMKSAHTSRVSLRDVAWEWAYPCSTTWAYAYTRAHSCCYCCCPGSVLCALLHSDIANPNT